ncbi:MAG: hypothetical protein ACE5DM_02775 [Candidatus Nanoarchaeia archaeon]
MKQDIKTAINKIVMDLSDEEGDSLPIAQIVKRAASQSISEADVMAELKVLVEEGILSQNDAEAVRLNE